MHVLPPGISIVPFGVKRAVLGEGPVWDMKAEVLYAIDIGAPAIHVVGPDQRSTVSLAEPPGAVALREGGGLLLAMGTTFWLLDPTTSQLEPFAELPVDGGVRLNDGKCDLSGRFWCGTATDDGTPNAGLYRLEADGRVSQALDGVAMSNGLGWSPDGGTFYYVDTVTHRVDRFDFDVETGRLANRRSLIEVAPDVGLPDGLTVDQGGRVWLAIWGSGQVRCFSPDGTLERIVPIPASKVTSCTFGGPQLDVLFVTSASYRLSEQDFKIQPLAGSIFAVQGLGVRGLLPALFPA